MASIVQRSGKFLREVTREMKRVSWPTRKDLTRYTIVTVSTVIFVAVFFALIDQGISSLIRLILG
ncbi:preprotein translocase subunit SecE [Guptibacillus algicola]|uniref:preprotein translocase subunit SecE n=1 Tax=Guptibacillus algicola TaxID=225844 RepID=UPI001CD20992|nr:preprotein translocase subunit SecE [Alkalihalobacillus algicola]MCA0989459.1 preprotein translocase subunit SecE [Alkalihalobacillus algicola]